MERWIVTFKAALAGDLARLGLIASLYVVFTLFEVGLPAERGHGFRGRVRNLLFGGIYLLGGMAASTGVMLLLPWRPHTRAAAGVGASMIVGVGYLMMIDCLYYWYHRSQHRFSFLWPVHELHHADAELNVTTSLRTYWLDLPIQFLVVTLPTLFLIGVDPVAWMMLPFLMTAWLLFAHANLRLPLGWLTPIVCGPHLHRVHHSNQRRHQNKNFAQFFPIYDVLFGTYYAPGRSEFCTTGTEHLASDATIGDVLLRPFRTWVRTLVPSSSRPARLPRSARRRARRA